MKTYKLMESKSNHGFGGTKANHQGSDDISTLQSELTSGWNILEATDFLSLGNNNEGGYLITLFHPNRLLTKDLLVKKDNNILHFLSELKVPGMMSVAA